MSFEYSVIARSYALSMLFIWLLAIIDVRRVEKPLIFGLLLALLANTNSHSFLISGVITTAFAWTLYKSGWTRNTIAGLMLAAVGIVLAFVQLLPREDPQVSGIIMMIEPEMLGRVVINVFFLYLVYF